MCYEEIEKILGMADPRDGFSCERLLNSHRSKPIHTQQPQTLLNVLMRADVVATGLTPT